MRKINWQGIYLIDIIYIFQVIGNGGTEYIWLFPLTYHHNSTNSFNDLFTAYKFLIILSLMLWSHNSHVGPNPGYVTWDRLLNLSTYTSVVSPVKKKNGRY